MEETRYFWVSNMSGGFGSLPVPYLPDLKHTTMPGLDTKLHIHDMNLDLARHAIVYYGTPAEFKAYFDKEFERCAADLRRMDEARPSGGYRKEILTALGIPTDKPGRVHLTREEIDEARKKIRGSPHTGDVVSAGK